MLDSAGRTRVFSPRKHLEDHLWIVAEEEGILLSSLLQAILYFISRLALYLPLGKLLAKGYSIRLSMSRLGYMNVHAEPF